MNCSKVEKKSIAFVLYRYSIRSTHWRLIGTIKIIHFSLKQKTTFYSFFIVVCKIHFLLLPGVAVLCCTHIISLHQLNIFNIGIEYSILIFLNKYFYWLPLLYFPKCHNFFIIILSVLFSTYIMHILCTHIFFFIQHCIKLQWCQTWYLENSNTQCVFRDYIKV